MADKKPNSAASGGSGGSGGHASGGGTSGGSHAPAPSRGWRDAWQLPALLLGGALLVGGLMHVGKKAPGPDFEGALAGVEKLIEQGKYEDALAMLNDPIAPNMGLPAATEEVHKQYTLLSADALAFAQRSRGINVRKNHEQISELYKTARKEYHATLTPLRQANLAESLTALGKLDDAMEEIKGIPDSMGERRRELLRKIVEEQLVARAAKKGAAPDEKLMDLLSRFRDDPAASGADRAWAVAKQTRMRLEAGFADEALRRLLPEIQRLDSRLTPEAGELFVLLGRCYAELGDPSAAEEHLKRAESALLESSPAFAESKVLQGRILQGHGKLEEAKEQYTLVASRFSNHSISDDAWLGLGEVEADLGNHEASVAAYEHAVEGIRKGPGERSSQASKEGEKGADVDPKVVASAEASLGQRHRDRLLKGDFVIAMRYADLAARLYPQGRTPATVIQRIAQTHRAAAEALIPPSAREESGVPDLSNLDPVTREEARRHYYEAAIAAQRHAREALIADPEAASDSLWIAADSFDNAGEQDRAADAFSQFIQTKRDGPKRLLAEYRLARVLQSKGQFKKAIELYEEIVEKSPVSDEAYLSYIPLAQCYLLASDDKDYEKAEKRLLQIVEGKQFQPTAGQFRTAVIELGRMYRRIANYPRAIERLTEAVTRYPDLQQDAGMQSNLADSYRLSATDLGRQLKAAMPQNERVKLQELRRERLEQSLEIYDKVRELLEAKDVRRLTSLEALMLRNAVFYRGDCAFDLAEFHKDDPQLAGGFYDRAIRYYDTAAQRYADDPSSLAAMMQIVSAYAALGRWPEAQTAQNRARARLKELPDQAWTDNNGPMDRQHWERWLESSVKLDQMAKAGGSEP